MLPIRVQKLEKTYRVGFWLTRRVHALRGIDLEVQPGHVYGLLGPNGAGKSTTIKILLNLVKPTAGTATIMGRPPSDATARRDVGYVPENPMPYEYLTGREFLKLSGHLVGLSGEDLDRRVTQVLGTVEMAAASKLQIRRYSKGMVQRIALAQALIADPKLLVLDEPTSGLDPLGRRQIRDIILEQRAKGTTVLFCSHIIPDVESLCDRVAVLVGGRVVREGSVRVLLGEQVQRVELVVEGLGVDQLRALGPAVESVQELEGRLLVRAPEAEAQALLRAVLQAGGRVSRLGPTHFGLEELFLNALKDAGQSVGAEISG